MVDAEWLAKKKKLLVKYGFIKPTEMAKYTGKTSREMDSLVSNMGEEEIKKLADVEHVEIAENTFEDTGYPKSITRSHLIFETTNDPIEESYFFEKDMIRVDFHYTDFYKITDVFAATEHSSFWGVAEQRLGLQQDKVSQYLRGISEMIKAMFQIVREIRIINERLWYYDDVRKAGPTALSSEITLKGIYIDQVEGGAKNPASVYGLANTVGFSILPDIFFRTQIKDIDRLDEQIDKQPFNDKVKEVLRRKLSQYYQWEKHTYNELIQRRVFTVKYLKQHYETIKLYINWIKPYLKNIERLQGDRKKLDSADMVSSFEGAMSEVEFLATKKFGDIYACILINFLFRTRPSMTYQAEGYQRGPMHIGRVEMTFRSYTWDQQQITNYMKMMEEENLQMLTTIDKSLDESLNALGQELFDYLEDAGEVMKEAKKGATTKATGLERLKKSTKGYLEPVSALFSGLGELTKAIGFSDFFSVGTLGKPKSKQLQKVLNRKKANEDVKRWIWMAYKNYKKAHKMITW